MPSSYILSIICGLIIISMIISGISYSRQQALAKRQRQIKKYRLQSVEIIGHIHLLLKIDPGFKLIIRLQNLVVNTLKAIQAIAPSDQTIKDNLNVQQLNLKNFNDHQRNNDITDHFLTDIELNQAQLQLSQISRLLDIYRNRGELPVTEYQELISHLQTLKLNLSVNSHIHQAENFGKSNDMAMYQMHIKQARDTLKKSDLISSEKAQRVKELSDILKTIKSTNKYVPLLNTANTDKVNTETSAH